MNKQASTAILGYVKMGSGQSPDRYVVMNSEIEWALRLFNRPALKCMRINHGRPHITVPQQFLNSSDIIVRR